MPPKAIDTHTLKILKDGKKGGVLVGRKHSECNSDGDCGIKATVSETGQPIEMQTNEVVITAPAVNDKDKHTFDGKTLTNKQILSKINEQGGGVSFAKGGEVKPKFEDGGVIPKDIVGTIIDFGSGPELVHKIVTIQGTEYAQAGSNKNLYTISDYLEAIENKDQIAARAEASSKYRDEQAKRDRENEERAEKELAEYNDIKGFLPNAPKLEKGKVLKYLNSYTGKGKVKDYILWLTENGGYIRDIQGKPVILYPNNGYETFADKSVQTKTAREYFEYLKEGGHPKNSLFEKGGELDCGCHHKMEHGGNVSQTLSNYEKDLLYGLSFDRLKYRVVKSAKDIQGIISEGYGYLTHGKAGKELHLTKKGVEYVRQMPKRVLGLEHFKRGGEIGGKHFRGIDYNYPSDFALNQAIEELIADRGDDLSPEEKLFVSAYSGMGGLQSEGAEGHGIMDEYYTPDEIVKYMWALAYKYGFDTKLPILEPSCGTGRFIKYAPYQKNVVGYDISETATKICRALYPKAEINNQSFEKLFISNNTSIGRKTRLMQKYGLAIGNPPYGSYSGLYAGLGEKDFTRAKNWVDYFIFRSLDLLLPGGLLVFIIGVEVQSGGVPFLAQQKNKVKGAIAEKSEIVDAYRLPAGLFERTNVVTDIIVLRKK